MPSNITNLALLLAAARLVTPAPVITTITIYSTYTVTPVPLAKMQATSYSSVHGSGRGSSSNHPSGSALVLRLLISAIIRYPEGGFSML
ncbi:hypothetical protein BCR34DRAFT_272364 [Clohesyomyces aquaticus]|uniref:Secreted protein n=1 Tax=Clohesyomyces aquaticus TaxID=1231657 RepID=A0A1Y1ZSN6_9PLEO|nr:hypothetical protein BCR34DRAFT_272364 [Clohesyomyces aquaticus]